MTAHARAARAGRPAARARWSGGGREVGRRMRACPAVAWSDEEAGTVTVTVAALLPGAAASGTTLTSIKLPIINVTIPLRRRR